MILPFAVTARGAFAERTSHASRPATGTSSLVSQARLASPRETEQEVAKDLRNLVGLLRRFRLPLARLEMLSVIMALRRLCGIFAVVGGGVLEAVGGTGDVFGLVGGVFDGHLAGYWAGLADG